MSGDAQNTKIVKLKPDIYQIRVDRPGSHVYLIKGKIKNMLVDTGIAANFDVLRECLSGVGLTPSDIHLIFLTHEHFDHVGACSHFFDTAIIAAHRLAANKIELQDEFVVMNKYFDKKAMPFYADLCLEGEATIDLGNYRFRTLHTPGHTSGCICLYEPDHRLLFTGDTLLADGILSGVFSSGNVSDYLLSLQKLSALKLDEIYPGHGRISTRPQEDLQKAIEEARLLLEESKVLFGVLDTRATFERLFYSWRKFPYPGD